MGSSNDFQSQTLETVEIVKLKRLPKFEDVAQARRRLRELCQCYNPENENSNWLEALDSTQWLTFVSKTLTFALEIAAKIKEERKWIVMMENRASDWSCVIASLVNIILFPRYRQKTELESLIVREWCLPRHPFSSRLELAAWPEDDRPGPLFPLFLDCVHQIWNQYPTEFDFTTDLLAVLHDASHAGLFREFLFHVEREEASLAPSVFHWKRLLSSDGLLLVQNPIWELAQLMGETKLDVLQIDVDVRQMRLWKEHYMRALTFMDIGQAGRAAYMWRLREMLGTLTVKPETDGVERRKKGNTEMKLPSGRDFSDISAFFPLSHEVSVVDTSRASCLPIRPHSVNDMLD